MNITSANYADALTQLGFTASSTGGGFSAWFKVFDDGTQIMISDHETDTQQLGELVDVGVYDEHGIQLNCQSCALDALSSQIDAARILLLQSGD